MLLSPKATTTELLAVWAVFEIGGPRLDVVADTPAKVAFKIGAKTSTTNRNERILAHIRIIVTFMDNACRQLVSATHLHSRNVRGKLMTFRTSKPYATGNYIVNNELQLARARVQADRRSLRRQSKNQKPIVLKREIRGRRESTSEFFGS